MDQPLNKTELLTAIQSEHAHLEHVIASIDPTRLTEPGVYPDNNWSVKDVVAHVVAWEQMLVDWLRARQLGSVPKFQPIEMWRDTDALNEHFWAEHRDQPLEDVLGDFQASFQQIITEIEALPDEAITSSEPFDPETKRSLFAHIACNTFEHYAEHTQAIQNWLDRIRTKA